MKKAFKMKQKAFFIIFKGLSLKQIKQIFLEGESRPTLKVIRRKLIKQLKVLNLFTWILWLEANESPW